jgi:hypothetical protein
MSYHRILDTRSKAHNQHLFFKQTSEASLVVKDASEASLVVKDALLVKSLRIKA